LQKFLCGIKPVEGVKAVRTVIVAAFVKDDVQKGFPAEQGFLAVWAKIFGFQRSFKTVVGLKNRFADLAAQLGAFLAVVVIQVYVRRVAERALFGLRNWFSVEYLDGLSGRLCSIR
jgi:hypothetical protein